MPYTDRSTIDSAFGSDHIDKWADVDNDANTTTIAAHIAWAITVADEEVDCILRTINVDLPAVTAAGTTPQKIKTIATEIAGHYIRTNKGEYRPTDGDPYERRVQRAYEHLEKIKLGEMLVDFVQNK